MDKGGFVWFRSVFVAYMAGDYQLTWWWHLKRINKWPPLPTPMWGRCIETLTLDVGIGVRTWTALRGAGPNAVLCKTCCVLLYVLEQQSVDHSSAEPRKHRTQLGVIGPIGLWSDLGADSSVMNGLWSEIYHLNHRPHMPLCQGYKWKLWLIWFHVTLLKST
jgi:hypothetical protein